MMTQKIVHRINILLIVCSVLAAVKTIFVDYSMDEEYQIVMAYRNLSGDTLFGTMWEPHQTSAFLCAWLMGAFRLITGGTTGVVLFLRTVTVGIQLALTAWIIRVFQKFTEKEYAFLLGCCYFNIVPKLIQIPEFSNLQLWCFTILVLSLLQYYDFSVKTSGGGLRKRKLWLLSAGVGMALEVLAYPGSILLFPFFLGWILYRSGKGEDGRWKLRPALGDGIAFTATCGLCAVIWLIVVLSRVTVGEFVRNLRYVLNFDLTHDLSLGAESRTFALLRDGKIMLLHVVLCAGIGGGILGLTNLLLRIKKKEPLKWDVTVFAVFMVLGAELVQMYYWVIRRSGYEAPQVHLAMLFLMAALVWRRADHRKYSLCVGILGGLLSILAAIYLSDLGIYYSVAHGGLGALMAMAVLVFALERLPEKRKKGLIYLLLFGMAFFTAFGKGYTLRAGRISVLPEVSGIIRKGPAAGVFTSYIQAYVMNCTYDDFEKTVQKGENCLIVTNLPGTAGTTPYLFQDLSISHFSIVDPTSYDERLLTYWECYPQKRPDVIVVDCWFGQLQEDPDNWIMRYIENEFGYTEVTDGTYVRFYRADKKIREKY